MYTLQTWQNVTYTNQVVNEWAWICTGTIFVQHSCMVRITEVLGIMMICGVVRKGYSIWKVSWGGVWRLLFRPPRGDFFVFLGVPRGDIRENLRPPRSASQTTPYPTISFSRGTLQWFVSLKFGSTPIKWGWAEKIDYSAIVGWSGLTPPCSDIERFGRPPHSDIGTILRPPHGIFSLARQTPRTNFSNGIALRGGGGVALVVGGLIGWLWCQDESRHQELSFRS